MSYFEHDCDMIMVGLLRQKSCYFYHYDCVILTPGARDIMMRQGFIIVGPSAHESFVNESS